MWIKRFPLVFLVLAVGCFFVALILFALIPQQVIVRTLCVKSQLIRSTESRNACRYYHVVIGVLLWSYRSFTLV